MKHFRSSKHLQLIQVLEMGGGKTAPPKSAPAANFPRTYENLSFLIIITKKPVGAILN